jgi:hypothetical protein
LHQNPTDTTTLKKHLYSFHGLYKKYPEVLTVHAGYGSEENYLLLAKHNIESYVKNNQFDREQHFKHVDWLKSDQLEYYKKKAVFYCPIGDEMKRTGTRITTDLNKPLPNTGQRSARDASYGKLVTVRKEIHSRYQSSLAKTKTAGQ